MNDVSRRFATQISATVYVLALVLFTGIPASGQALPSLRGTIADPSGAAIVNATIHLINTVTNADRTTSADPRGAYSFQDVAPGVYRLVVEAPGFDKYEQSGLQVQSNAPITLDIKMQIAQLQQTVTVTTQGVEQHGDQCVAPQGRILPDIGTGLRAFRRGPSGNYYALTAPGTAAFIYSPSGTRIGQIPAKPSPDSSIAYGSDLQIDSTGRVYIADRAANAIKIYSPDGNLVGKIHVVAPVSVEPLIAGEVAVSSLTSKHLVDVYDEARGEVYRSFGDVATPDVTKCDNVTLRCTIPANTGALTDASRLNESEPSLNRSWFYGDSAGNVYLNLVDLANPTIRKYDSYGYLAFETPFPLTRADSGTGDAGWKVAPEVRLAGVGTIEALDSATQSNSNNSTTSSGDPSSGTDAQLSGGRPAGGGGMGGGAGGEMHGGGGEGMHGGAPGGAGMRGGGMNMNRMTFGVRFTQHGGSASAKPVIDALGVDAASQDIWAAIGGNLVHFDKDGRLAGYYCLSTSDQVPIRPTTLLVEPDRILLGTDPFGIFQYPRPDKPTPNP